MRLHNCQEDIVLYVIDLVLDEKSDREPDEDFINDVAAIALNRLTPRYITSERGFQRYAREFLIEDAVGDQDEQLMEFVTIYSLVQNAIDVVTTRRRNGQKPAGEGEAPAVESLVELEYWHNFPHIIGRVIDKDSREPVVGATATLYLDGTEAKPASVGWPNPYTITTATQGYYSFWPASVRSPAELLKTSAEVRIHHEAFEPAVVRHTLKTSGTFDKSITIQPYNVCRLAPSMLSPINGGSRN